MTNEANLQNQNAAGAGADTRATVRRGGESGGSPALKYRKKPIVIEAIQWFRNGDHPGDYIGDTQGFENGELRVFTGEERQARDWEGMVVRYYRTPKLDGQDRCRHCNQIMHFHGWIDTLEGGHIVCPGDWIITGIKGENYPCKPDIFSATYEPAEAVNSHAALQAENARLREALNELIQELAAGGANWHLNDSLALKRARALALSPKTEA